MGFWNFLIGNEDDRQFEIDQLNMVVKELLQQRDTYKKEVEEWKIVADKRRSENKQRLTALQTELDQNKKWVLDYTKKYNEDQEKIAWLETENERWGYDENDLEEKIKQLLHQLEIINTEQLKLVDQINSLSDEKEEYRLAYEGLIKKSEEYELCIFTIKNRLYETINEFNHQLPIIYQGKEEYPHAKNSLNCKGYYDRVLE